jgi:dihydropteroate synthase
MKNNFIESLNPIIKKKLIKKSIIIIDKGRKFRKLKMELIIFKKIEKLVVKNIAKNIFFKSCIEECLTIL